MTASAQTIQVTTPACMSCRKSSILEVTLDQYSQLKSPRGPHIQHIFPDWPASKRELLLTGTHPECWEKMFGNEDYDDEM